MNILLVSHGTLCAGVYDAYQMLMGPTDTIDTLSLTVDGGIEGFRAEFNKKMDDLVGKGVLVMADLKGGTPYNEAYARYLQDPARIRIACGLNLPMLIEVGMDAASSDDLEAIYQRALSSGALGVSGAAAPGPDACEIDDDLF